jgi:hypothetical protein
MKQGPVEEGEPISVENPLPIGVPWSDAELKRRGMDPKAYAMLVATQGDEDNIVYKDGKKYYKAPDGTLHTGQVDDHEKEKKTRSAFPQRKRSHIKVRENWMPTSSPMMQTEQQDLSQPPSTIWEKINSYGKDIDKKVKRFVKHVKYNPSTDKPISSFQNPRWKNEITRWLQGRKQKMVEAIRSGDKQSQQFVSESTLNLIQDVTTYSSKFLDWLDRNSGENKPGSKGASVVSLGSKKDEKFIGDMAFMGDLNTNIMVGEDGKIGIKSFGLSGVKYVEDLDLDVFARDDAGKITFLEASGKLQKDAESGKPLNSSVITGYVDELLKNEDSILSWAFDPLYGQSWIQDWSQANPDQDPSVFMPESPSFDIDLLTDELHGWMKAKLDEAYSKNLPQQPQQRGDKAQQIMNQTVQNVEQEKQNKQGVYAEQSQQPQQPQQPQQGSPMAYTSKSLKLIEKFRSL